MISLEKLKILAPTQNIPKTVGDLCKLIVAKGFKNCPKSNILPNLVTLVEMVWDSLMRTSDGGKPFLLTPTIHYVSYDVL